MTYDPLAYWTAAGASYEVQFDPERYRVQETALGWLLATLDFWTVLDVGCGFGRMYDVIQRVRPPYGGRQPEPDLIAYVGIDLSPTMIAAARDRLPVPGVELINASLAGYQPTGSWGIKRFDLVIASEVLMHIPPAEIEAAIQKLISLGDHIVTVDWTEPIEGETAPHNFRHDYDALWGDLPVERVTIGSQTLYHVVTKVPVPA